MEQAAGVWRGPEAVRTEAKFESAAKAKMDVAVNKVVDNYRIDLVS